MISYLLDTNHAGQLLKDDTQLRGRMASTLDAEFGLCRPSIGELWYGVFNSARVDENRARLNELIREFRICEYDEAACLEYGRIRLELRRAGTPIPQIDIQVAAIARASDLIVLSADQHFRKVRALRVENWL